MYLINLAFCFSFICASFAAMNVAKSAIGANIFHLNTAKQGITFGAGLESCKKILKAAKQAGFAFIRLSINMNTKMHEPGRAQDRDFLFNCDEYTGLIENDVHKLREVLDFCAEIDLKVILTTLSLPGARWVQHNSGKRDLRIYREPRYWSQAGRFWQNLIKSIGSYEDELFKSHPAVVGYNLLNEPCPELVFNQADELRFQKAADVLYEIYEEVIKCIREVDSKTAIVLDGPDFTSPDGFEYFRAHDDPNIVYSFHFYLCYRYNKLNHYPGSIYPTPWKADDKVDLPTIWNKDKIEELIAPVKRFQEKYSISSERILVGELGGHRRTKGLGQFFRDARGIFKRYGYNVAIYSFREAAIEDGWPGMDYEFSPELPDYYKRTENHRKPENLEKIIGPIRKRL